MLNLFDECRSVVAALSAAGVPYAICGGLAMAVHAQPRATIDIDLLAPPDAIPALTAALAPLGFTRREREPTTLAGGAVTMHRLTKIAPGDPDVLVLDVIEARSGVVERAWMTVSEADWEGQRVMVVSRTGLIDLKRLRNSAQDRVDISRLEGDA